MRYILPVLFRRNYFVPSYLLAEMEEIEIQTRKIMKQYDIENEKWTEKSEKKSIYNEKKD